MKFTKMQSLGNDFVVIGPQEKLEQPSPWAKLLCSRHYGAGADGLVVIGASDHADVRMRIFNPDGSEAEMCGNALRSVGMYVYEKGILSQKEMTVETLGGVKRVYLDIRDGRVVMVTAQLPAPEVQWVERPVEVEGQTFLVTAMSLGNPHCVSFLCDVDGFHLQRYGKAMSCHPVFPEGVNAEFAQVVDFATLKMRVYERGVGETLACGTGSCVSVVGGYLTGRCDNSAQVLQAGGVIMAEYRKAAGELYMTGPSAFVYEGEWHGTCV